MQVNLEATELNQRLRNIRLLALDVDGVLTSGALYFSDSGEEIKAFCVLDGQGIKLLQENGVRVAIISGRSSPLLARRAQNLGVTLFYQGREDKLTALDELCLANGFSYSEIAYAGDDLPDIQIIKAVAVSFTVPNAHSSVKEIAHACTEHSGGSGAVREIADFILQSQGKYEKAIARFL
jgi:3-deoxy-D-manno-octulosonate 8-phosphate phosphatase (KDO 8-P phosphatase)